MAVGRSSAQENYKTDQEQVTAEADGMAAVRRHIE